ncbi:hypothetical protein Pmani_001488 [Petrolisthes manimaculis]|uniref:Uncharacterized protein n=1 Tax=Petrolisthes manimaculis TaxID=1843537 RepID=A0AAE1QJ98_9EUCA|nr:hypothetical protein Pmani_001488 [Petrolisthes manimaculis]
MVDNFNANMSSPTPPPPNTPHAQVHTPPHTRAGPLYTMPHVPQPNQITVETNPMGPWFKGRPTEHVHNFVREVEALMAAKGITDDIEKINFIKARIRGDAIPIISGSSFCQRYIGDIYINYRQALLKSFGKEKNSGQFAWIPRVLDVAVSNTRSLDMATSRIVAIHLYENIVDTLAKAAPLPTHPTWTTQRSLFDGHSVGELFEYFLFLQMLKPEDYRVAKSVERKNGEHFVSVTERIGARMIPPTTPYANTVPSEGATAHPQMADAAVSNSGIEPVPKQHATKGYYKATLEVKSCRECKKHRHTWDRCYSNENREERTKKPTSRPEGSTNKNVPQRKNKQPKPRGAEKWCDLHEVTSHANWECRGLMEAARELVTQRQNESSEEEGNEQEPASSLHPTQRQNESSEGEWDEQDPA